MTSADLHTLLEACKSVPLIVLQAGMPSSPQDNANRAWQSLGHKMGFNYLTVKPLGSKGSRFFTAEPLEIVVEATDGEVRGTREEAVAQPVTASHPSRPALKPCPFCGNEQLSVKPNIHTGFLRVQCEACWAVTATSVSSTKRSTAIAAWNRRADPVRASVIEECAKLLDSKADLYRAYETRAATAGDNAKAGLMNGHYLTLWEAAKSIRSLASAGKASAKEASAERAEGERARPTPSPES